MKIIITESQYERLLGDLSPALKRRITQEDLDWITRRIIENVKYYLYDYYSDHYTGFLKDIVGSVLHDYITEIRGDEIETEEDPDYGEVYNEESKKKVFDLYWELSPLIIKHFEPMLKKIWNTQINKK